MKITDETRRKVQQMTEEVSRGFIDDSEVDFPDDEEVAALKREARQADERRLRVTGQRRKARAGGAVGAGSDIRAAD
jgi:hypothetical protein